ncbi:MAG TPA: hypothetical protein VF618_02105 [Thermoanaerobaculia bacterium]
MKRILMVLVVLLVATSLFAGGKECNLNKSAKNVELTGTLVQAEGQKAVFRVADSNKSYTVCEQTKSDVLELSNTAIRVKAKLVSCGEGEELVISEARKI